MSETDNIKQNHDNNSNTPTTKPHYDPLNRIFTGLVIIWLGVSLLLENQHYFRGGDWWAYFIFGLGVLFFAEAIFRLMRPESNQRYNGKIIAGAVLIAFGANHIYDLQNWWPLLLVAAGAIIVFITMQRDNNNEQEQNN